MQAAIELLGEDSILLVAVYPGHEEGAREGEMLSEYLSTLDRRQISVTRFGIINSRTSPFFFIIETR